MRRDRAAVLDIGKDGVKPSAMYEAWLGGTPMGRMGEVEEIASDVFFVAGDAASLMTGSIVVVDGGYTCW